MVSILWTMATLHVMEPPSSQIGLFHRISNIVSSELCLDEMLDEIVGLTAQVTVCDACLVYLLERETDEVGLRASQVPLAAALGDLRHQVVTGVSEFVAEPHSVGPFHYNSAADGRFPRFPH